MKYVCFLISALTASYAIADETQDIKPGLWQIETRVSGKAPASVMRCFNEEILAEEMSPPVQVKSNCKRKNSPQSSRFQSEISCDDGTTGLIVIEKISIGHLEVKQTITFNAEASGSQTGTSESTQRWSKSDCGNLKPGEYGSGAKAAEQK